MSQSTEVLHLERSVRVEEVRVQQAVRCDHDRDHADNNCALARRRASGSEMSSRQVLVICARPKFVGTIVGTFKKEKSIRRCFQVVSDNFGGSRAHSPGTGSTAAEIVGWRREKIVETGAGKS